MLLGWWEFADANCISVAFWLGNPRTIGEHTRVVVGTDPLHVQCLTCGLRAAHSNGYRCWTYLRTRGSRNPLALRRAAVAHEAPGEAEPHWLWLALLDAARLSWAKQIHLCSFRNRGTIMSGRGGGCTMEMNGRSATSYLARTLCVLVFCLP